MKTDASNINYDVLNAEQRIQLLEYFTKEVSQKAASIRELIEKCDLVGLDTLSQLQTQGKKLDKIEGNLCKVNEDVVHTKQNFMGLKCSICSCDCIRRATKFSFLCCFKTIKKLFCYECEYLNNKIKNSIVSENVQEIKPCMDNTERINEETSVEAIAESIPAAYRPSIIEAEKKMNEDLQVTRAFLDSVMKTASQAVMELELQDTTIDSINNQITSIDQQINDTCKIGDTLS